MVENNKRIRAIAIRKKAAATESGSGLKRIPNFHRVEVEEICLHARSSYKAAKAVAASFRSDSASSEDTFVVEACPAFVIYRYTLELYLKWIILGEGGNFLPEKPDFISVSTSNAVTWLAQFLCQIVTALKWEAKFRCAGIDTLADFKALAKGLSMVEPSRGYLSLPFEPKQGWLMPDFIRKMDTVLDLVDSIGEALKAEWESRLKARVWDTAVFDGTIQ